MRTSAYNGYWYARAVCDETYDTEKLARHMSEHNTPYSPGVIHGVLKDMINCIKELVLDGKNVKLNDLAIFSVGLKSAGAANLEDFSVNEHIKGVRLRARATGELSSSALKAESHSPLCTRATASSMVAGRMKGEVACARTYMSACTSRVKAS